MTPEKLRELQRREAMLEGVVREMLRIARASRQSTTSVPPEEALEGRLLSEWKSIERKALSLLP